MVDHLIRGLSTTLFWRRALHPLKYHLIDILINSETRLRRSIIRAILEWPSPKNIIELRGFNGICTYYRKFVKGFSKLTSPLTDMTNKDDFKWAFQKMKIM